MSNIVVDSGNGLEKVILTDPEGGSAEVYLHGAHVTSWKTPSGEELLFVSSQAVFKPPKAIRGGIPICFPQFGNLGPLAAQHGFARNTPWKVLDSKPGSVSLLLEPNDEQLELFPHPFKLVTEVTVSKEGLSQRLEVQNTGSDALPFTVALHSYFKVSSIDKVHIDSLTGSTYLDSLKDRASFVEEASGVRFEEEVDRIYLNTPGTLQIVDEGRGRAFRIKKEGLPDAIIWNPWVDKAKGMADFGDDEYKEMVCLEPAVASSGPVILEPGAVWKASVLFSIVPQ